MALDLKYSFILSKAIFPLSLAMATDGHDEIWALIVKTCEVPKNLLKLFFTEKHIINLLTQK